MFRLGIRPYQRPLRQPLTTHHGVWQCREGLIVQLSDDHGQVAYGEIAPLPWFSTETLATATTFLNGLGDAIAPAQIPAVPRSLPACQFALSAAAQALQGECPPPLVLTVANTCALLPGGNAALEAWQPLWTAGYRTFKGKIGTHPLAEELATFAALMDVLPVGARLRLDANGGLTVSEAETWLMHCREAGDRVEFLEQPLPPSAWDALVTLAEGFPGAIALDESVATLPQLATVLKSGWPGLVVIKPAIAGHIERLQDLCGQYQPEVVFSSALETPIGRQAALSVAAAIGQGQPPRALGFGVGQWFSDDWDTLTPEALWAQL